MARVEALYSVIETVFCLSWGFVLVSTLQVHRAIRRLGINGEEAKTLYSGTRPIDPDELIAWANALSVFPDGVIVYVEVPTVSAKLLAALIDEVAGSATVGKPVLLAG